MESEKRLNEYFEKYVPAFGAADSNGGELVRAVSRLGYRFWNDGDMIGVGYGRETCDAAARFILIEFDGTEMAEYVKAMWGLDDSDLYEEGLKLLIAATVGYLDRNQNEFTNWIAMSFDEFGGDEEEEEYFEHDQEYYDLMEYPKRDWRR